MVDPIHQSKALIPVTDPEKIEDIKRDFWPKLGRAVGRIPFVDDLLAAYFCAVDPATPMRVRGVLMAALAYFVLPTDLIPDLITGLGFTDDATVLATTIGIVSSYIKPSHKSAARHALDLPPLEDGS